MENASKALLIAGAILLSILIIGVGIAVFSNTQGTIDSTMGQIGEQEINAFNSKFTSYQGDAISGSNVKALLNALASNYASYKDEPSMVPTVDATGLGGTEFKAEYTNEKADSSSNNETGTETTKTYNSVISNIRNKIVNKNTYSVTMNYGDSGVIDTITITDQTK